MESQVARVEWAKGVLAECFRALSSERKIDWRANLAYHVERETPILCQDASCMWADGRGAG